MITAADGLELSRTGDREDGVATRDEVGIDTRVDRLRKEVAEGAVVRRRCLSALACASESRHVARAPGNAIKRLNAVSK